MRRPRSLSIGRLPIPDVVHFPLEYPPGSGAIGQLAAALSTFRPDIVHVVAGGVRLLRDIGHVVGAVPWLFTAHNVPPHERILSGLYGHNILHRRVRDARALPSMLAWARLLRVSGFRAALAHSETVAARLRAYGCPAEKVQEVPFGFDAPTPVLGAESPFPAGASPKLLSIAGLAHHKGIHDVLAVLPELVREFPELHYTVIGEPRDAGYAAFLERRIMGSPLAANVSVLRAASEATKSAALRSADVYIQASHEEGFCLAFAEGAACVPRLLGTRTGEIARIAADDGFARVVEPRRPRQLLGALRALIHTNVSEDAVARRIERLRRRYSWLNYFDRHFTAYRSFA